MARTISAIDRYAPDCISHVMTYTDSSGGWNFELPQASKAIRIAVNTSTWTGATSMDLYVLSGCTTFATNAAYTDLGAVVSGINGTGWDLGALNASTTNPIGPFIRFSPTWTGTNTNWIATIYIAYIG